MTTSGEDCQRRCRRGPVRGNARRRSHCLEQARQPGGSGDCRCDVPDDCNQDNGRISPPAHPSLLQTSKPVEYLSHGVDGGTGTGHLLGRRPPQAPRSHRQRRRPPQSSRWAWGGVRGVLAGLWHAHSGWLMSTKGVPTGSVTQPICTRIGNADDRSQFVPLVLRQPVVPGPGWLSRQRHTRRRRDGAALGGLVRIFFVHHVTWSVNSVCHFFGSRRFDTEIARPTCFGSPFHRSASPGTTITMPFPVLPSMACQVGDRTRPP